MSLLSPRISVVIPLYNEADNLADLHRELTASLQGLGHPYEVLLVDDGSRDGSRERLVLAGQPLVLLGRRARGLSPAALA